MDGATLPSAALATATKPSGAATTGVDFPDRAPLPTPPTLELVWPRPAQWAAAVLLIVAVLLLAVHARSYLRGGTRPADLQHGAALTYRVDLNTAKLPELLQLPGVGPKMAQRIEQYRTAKGGFRSIDELLQVGGIGSATLERLRPWVCVGPDDAEEDEPEPPAMAVKKPEPIKGKPIAAPRRPNSKVEALKGARIDVNRASLQDLQRLPGIGPKMAQRIVDERGKRPFTKVDDLRRVSGIGPKTLTRLQPYITVGSPKLD